jgi:hypothetical protein
MATKRTEEKAKESKWTAEKAEKYLAKTTNNVSVSGKLIRIGYPGPGIKVWGVIDYLQNHQEYRVVRTE